MKTTLYLIRHGDYDTDDISQLTDQGKKQANEIMDRLSDTGIAHIISSPISRVLKTAQPLAMKLNMSVEQNESFAVYFPDSDEAFGEALEKVVQGLASVTENYSGQTIAVFTHGFSVGEFLIWIGYGSREELPVGSVQTGAYAKLVHEDGRYVVEETYRIEKV